MIPKEVANYLKEVEPLSPIAAAYVRTVGTISGSYVFGGYEEGSDIDFLIPPKANTSLFPNCLCYASGDYVKPEFRSFYVKLEDGTVFNLLFMNDQESFDKWEYATRKMREDSADFTNKEVRVSTFEHYKKKWEKNNE